MTPNVEEIIACAPALSRGTTFDVDTQIDAHLDQVTVKELINALSKFPSDTPVAACLGSYSGTDFDHLIAVQDMEGDFGNDVSCAILVIKPLNY